MMCDYQIRFSIQSLILTLNLVQIITKYMSSGSQTEEEQFVAQKKVQQSDQQSSPKQKSVSKSKSKSKQKQKSKGKRNTQKNKKKQGKKQVKKQGKKQVKKQPKKKREKASKSKAKSVANPEQDLALVKQYMQKQNRPYSMINVYDNLHGKIKKTPLESILDSLADEGSLACKQFGKNKVYFRNQSNFQIDEKQLETVGNKLSQAREQLSELTTSNKSLSDQLRRITSQKTTKQLENQNDNLQLQIQKLLHKKNKLTSEVEEKVEEHLVIKVQKEENQLRKKLRTLKKIKKQCVDIWMQILEKKRDEVADIIGIDL